jgi:DNA-binding MarR family transcriptional regulator
MPCKPRLDDGVSASVPRLGEGKRGEAGYLGYLLRQAAGAVRLRLERALADLEITPAQFVVLTMLDAYPGASGADVARLALLTPQTVHGITSNLTRVGLVARQPHPVHGRVQRLGLTPEGQALLSRCRERARQMDAALAAGFSAEEEAVIRRWLVSLAVASNETDSPVDTEAVVEQAACSSRRGQRTG